MLDNKKLEEKIKLHEKLWGQPNRAERLCTFGWFEIKDFDISTIFTDARKSLEYSLLKWNKRGDFEDDSIPMMRIEVGTVLVASAFGAEVHIRNDGMPAVKSHPMQSMADLEKVGNPNPLTDGIFPQTYEKIRYFRQNMSAGFRLSPCDMQGPWNTAQVLVGEKIFLDVYDNPRFICSLLDSVTDFMIKAVPMMKKSIGEEWEYFYLQGTKIPGASRLCNCSTDMISPDFYESTILPRDIRFYDAMNGGMMHICGNHMHCIKHFNKIEKLHGLEVNFNYLDVFKISDLMREDMVLLCTGPVEYPLLTPLGEATLNKFYKGQFPDKRNILFHFNDPSSLDKAKKLYGTVRG